MNFNRLVWVAVLCVFATSSISAQRFIKPFFTFSGKKTSYVTLNDGTELEGTIERIYRKKGLIEKIKLEVDGDDRKIEAGDIKFMYLPPSGWDKFASATDFMNDATQWGKVDLDNEILEKGYVYFEQTEVKIKKKKTETLLMQLLNPSFSAELKVYHDPRAKETTSLGVAGIKVAGGDSKSYYIKKGDAIAFKLKKKNYDEEYMNMYKGCDALIQEIDGKPKWSQLEDHVYKFATECDKN